MQERSKPRYLCVRVCACVEVCFVFNVYECDVYVRNVCMYVIYMYVISMYAMYMYTFSDANTYMYAYICMYTCICIFTYISTNSDIVLGQIIIGPYVCWNACNIHIYMFVCM